MIIDPNSLARENNSFIRHRFITDAVGHLVASYAAFGMVYVIDNVSHTPSKFSHWVALSFAASLIFVDYIFGKKWGNSQWYGLISLSVAAIVGYVIFFVLAEIISVLTTGVAGMNDVFIGWLFMSPIFLVPALAVPLLVRLLVTPVLWVFRRES
jgi:hypothetical protein